MSGHTGLQNTAHSYTVVIFGMLYLHFKKLGQFSNAYQVLYYKAITGTIDYDLPQYHTIGLVSNVEFEENFEVGDRASNFYDFKGALGFKTERSSLGKDEDLNRWLYLE